MDIVIDFDGTVVTHEFPNIGKDIGAVPVLKELISNGHNLILFTMRSDIENPTSGDDTIIPKGGKYLTEAIEWFRINDIPLYGVQVNPTQHSWTHSPKAYGQVIIDDAALGCPLTYCSEGLNIVGSQRPFVNWKKVREWFIHMELITPEHESSFHNLSMESNERTYS